MNRQALYFTGPRRLELRDEALPALAADEILVQTRLSAISAGTEMLVYRGGFPGDLSDQIDRISSALGYPLTYGYAAVGTVIARGEGVGQDWEGRRVFAFREHASMFVSRAQDVLPVPAEIPDNDAVFLPNMETAVNLVQDGAPLVGERCLVLGQGIVGLLTAALLREFPLDCLVAADRYDMRRRTSAALGVSEVFDPGESGGRQKALRLTGGDSPGFDLVIEISGNPAAIDDAIALTSFSGRIVVGSWYGRKSAAIDFGGRFHRSRIRLVSSQVSTISPELAGRWTKSRRFDVAWEALERIQPARWITHSFPIERAAAAYALLDDSPEETLQVVITYPE